MTDEEKAEEILQTKGSMTFCAKGCGYTEKVKKFITIGIAEGRKEQEKKDKGFCESFCMKDRKENWHDLRKNPDDLPKCTENEQIIFYVHEYYKDIEKYINHYCLGFYKKSFLNDDVKLFVERSKGYECEHSTEDVLRWCELPKFKE